LRGAHETWVLASAPTGLAWIAAGQQGDYGAAHAHFEEALVAWRATGDQVNVAICLCNLAQLAWRQEQYEVARAPSEESLDLARSSGDTRALSQALLLLRFALMGQGDLAGPARHWRSR